MVKDNNIEQTESPKEKVHLSDEQLDKCILSIDNFQGPLDLLWNLIRKSKIDIMDISLASITEQYISYLKMMEELNFQIATSFIELASDLLVYKSKALLPTQEVEDEFFVPPLPPELIEKLLEYKKYQMASGILGEQFEDQADTYTRTNAKKTFDQAPAEYINVTLFDLLNAFAEILEANVVTEEKDIIFDEILVSDRMDFILNVLKEKEEFLFKELFSSLPSKAELIASFLAILELTKIHRIRVVQKKVFDDIYILRLFNPVEEQNFDISNVKFN